MKLLQYSAGLLALFLSVTIVARAEEKIKASGETEFCSAITKGLGYLAKGSDEWMADKSCNSCHHMPQVLWNHREARLRGFPIDEKKFDEWVEWSDKNATLIGPGLEMTAFMKLAMPEKAMPELTKLIVKGQQADGSWKLAGQFTAQRKDAHEVAGNSTRIFLLALAANEADKQVVEEVSKKAQTAKNDPPKSVETLTFRGIFAQRLGKADDAAAIRADIAKLQHADGGWGWLISEPQSDAIATGLALYALQPPTTSSNADAIARAQRWLLNNQKEDGGWPVDYSRISKGDRSKPDKAKSLKDATMIYSYWGTAWSTLGLLQAVPVMKK